MPTQEEEASAGGGSSAAMASTDLEANTTGVEDPDSTVLGKGVPGTGEEIQIAVSTPSAADTTATHARASAICKRRETGGNSIVGSLIVLDTVLTRTADSVKATAAEICERPTTIPRQAIAPQTQVSSAANLQESLPEVSRTEILSLARTLRGPREKRSAPAVPISLVGVTHQRV